MRSWYFDQKISFSASFAKHFIFFLLIITLSSIHAQNIPSAANLVAGIGGWPHGLGKQGNHLLLLQGSMLNTFENTGSNYTVVSQFSLPAEPKANFFTENTLFLSYEDENLNDHLDIIDISNPLHTKRLSQTPIEGIGSIINSIKIRGNYAYLTTGAKAWEKTTLIVVDVSNLSAPVKLGQINIPIRDYAVQDNRVVILEGGGSYTDTTRVHIFDTTDKSNLISAGTTPVHRGNRILTGGNTAFITSRYEKGIKLFDITDSSNPDSMGGYDLANHKYYDMAIYGNRLYVEKQGLVLTILDISDTQKPALMGEHNFGRSFILDVIDQHDLYMRIRTQIVKVNASDPANLITTELGNSPGILTGIAVTTDYLYALAEDLIWIYNIRSASEPTLVNSLPVQDANTIFCTQDIAIVTHIPQNMSIYDLSDAENPEILSTFATDATINDVYLKENTLYFVTTTTNVSGATPGLYIVDVQDPRNPQLLGEMDLPGEGVALDMQAHLVVMYKNNQESNGFDLVNISDPSSPVLLNRTLFGHTPINVVLQDSILFVGLNETNNENGLLQVYDISAPENTELINEFILSSTSPLTDVLFLEGVLLFSLYTDHILQTATWNAFDGSLNMGLSMAMHKPILLASNSNDPLTAVLQKKSHQASFTRFIYALAGKTQAMYEGMLMGNGGLGIFKLDIEPDMVTLTMGKEPDEAVACGTTPEVGVHKYRRGTVVNLGAHPDPSDGWFFKEWTGNVSGPEPQKQILMNSNKKVTAHFHKLELTVSGSDDRRIFCASLINKKERIIMLPVTLCASKVDGWTVNKIKFKTRGTGAEDKDIKNVYVIRNANIIFTGKPSTDNALVEAEFQPPLNISAGECITLYFAYDFKTLDINSYAADEPKTFLAETQTVIAKPWNYEEGLISGKAETGLFTIGRVYNTSLNVFRNISHALGSYLISNNDTCFVCPGEYHDDINMSGESHRNVSLKSVAGRDSTLIADINLPILYFEGRQNITVDGFTFKGKDHQEPDMHIKNSSNIILKNNNFMVNHLDFDQINNCYIQHNNFYNETNIHIHNNSKSNVIRSNHSIVEKSVINLSKGAHDNEIIENEGFAIHIDDYRGTSRSSHNLISNNRTHKISSNSSHNLIISNTVTGSRDNGIEIHACFDFLPSNNAIEKNKIFANNGSGISILEGLGTDIIRNTIYTNEGSGLVIDNTMGTLVKKNVIVKNNKNGVNIENSVKTIVEDNSINYHKTDDAVGIFVSHSLRTSIFSNNLIQNCTNIEVSNSRHTRIGLNNQERAFCFFTGIHLNNSSPVIFGNRIVDNSGYGIFAENGSQPVVHQNTITGNSEFGLDNTDPTVKIDARNNWWGNASGPGMDGVNGNVDASNWLSQPVDLVMISERDTIHVRPDQQDSIVCRIQNWSNRTDNIIVSMTVNGSDWFDSPEDQSITLTDSIGGSAVFSFKAPYSALGTINTIICKASSTSDPSQCVTDSCVIRVFESRLASMIIVPDSVVLEPEESHQFTAQAVDSSGHIIPLKPVWSATHGQIDQSGFYTAPDDTGQVIVTASDPSTGIYAISRVQVSAVTLVHRYGKSPVEFGLDQNFPNPFNPTTSIGFHVKTACRVTLKVFNLAGQTISILADSNFEKGHHNVTFEAKDLPSGLYIYQIQMGSFEQSRKMLLLK